MKNKKKQKNIKENLNPLLFFLVLFCLILFFVDRVCGKIIRI